MVFPLLSDNGKSFMVSFQNSQTSRSEPIISLFMAQSSVIDKADKTIPKIVIRLRFFNHFLNWPWLRFLGMEEWCAFDIFFIFISFRKQRLHLIDSAYIELFYLICVVKPGLYFGSILRYIFLYLSYMKNMFF